MKRTALYFLLLLGLVLSACDDGGKSGGEPDGGEPDGSADSDADADTDTEYLAWEEKVEEFWGEAPDQETRLEMFDEVWERFADVYACFDTFDVDWDEVRDEYRPLIEQAEGYGHFYRLMREMFDLLQDPHSPLLSETICQTSLSLRPPVVRLLNVYPVSGGCITLDEDGELLVYRVAASDKNPLSLEPGDVILGFDDKSFLENLEDLERWPLPECDEDFAAAPVSYDRQRAAALPANAHLFDTIQVRKYATGQEESYSTDLIVESSKDLMVCADAIPVEGVDPPVERWSQMDYQGCSNCLSYGIIPNTNIGYINSYAWYGGALADFQTAVDDLMGTDGLIVDQRFNLGGVVQFLDYGFPTLFGEDVEPLVSFQVRSSVDDYTGLTESYYAWIDAEEGTSYDNPIAVLTGPKSGSAGDLCPYALSFHPHSRSFGRATNGAFGELLPVWNPVDPHIGDFSLKVTRAQMVSAEGDHLNAWEQVPDEAVWITKDDAASEIDPIFQAALDWIDSENAK